MLFSEKRKNCRILLCAFTRRLTEMRPGGIIETEKKEAENMKTSAVVVAAGNSTRMGGGSKLLLCLDGEAVLARTLRRLDRAESITALTVVARPADFEAIRALCAGLQKPLTLVPGGDTRQASVLSGVRACADADFVAIHDGARPLIQPDDVNRVCAAAQTYGAATLAVPVKDTVTAVRNGVLCETPDRATLFAVQTPQVFQRAAYLAAAARAEAAGEAYTDDCQLLRANGVETRCVRGSYENIKITTPEDLRTAEAFLHAEKEV